VWTAARGEVSRVLSDRMSEMIRSVSIISLNVRDQIWLDLGQGFGILQLRFQTVDIYRCDSYMKMANFTHNLGLFDAVDGVLPNGVSLSARPTPL